MWPAIIGAAAAIGGGLFSNNSNARMAADQRQSDERAAQMSMDFSAKQAHEQMAFQERMAGSSHQREIVDLKAAGLNPILSGTGGMGSASPAGASGQGSKAQNAMQAPMPNILEAATHSALQARKNKAETENLEEDTKLKRELKRAAHEQIYGNYWKSTLTQTENESEMARRDMLRNQLPGSETEAEIDRNWYGYGLRYTDRAAGAVGSALGARRLLQPGLQVPQRGGR